MKKFFKSLFSQKGQTLVLYALLVPLLFMVGGAGVDLGWYYYNKARLQNMADAAVIAGAKAMLNPLNEGNLTDYTYNYFLAEIPARVPVSVSNRSTEKGDEEAQNYIRRNYLSGTSNWNNDTIQDNFNNSTLNFKKTLYEKTDDSYKPLYYELELTEKHTHLFDIFNGNSEYSLGDAIITAKAVAKFTHVPDSGSKGGQNGPNLIEQMEAVKAIKAYSHFWEIDHDYKLLYDKKKADLVSDYLSQGYSQEDAEAAATNSLKLGDITVRKDVTFKQAQNRTVQTSGNWWDKSKLTNYRTENNTLRGIGGPSWNIDQFNLDDLFIDFKVDVKCDFKSDWDIGEPQQKGISYSTGYNKIFDSETDPEELRYNYRIHSLICIESVRDKNVFPYKVREGRESPDPLFARIESEQIKRHEYQDAGSISFNSVHQIIIQVKYPNDKSDDRPLVFFYDGPEKIDENSHVRDSKPVILNMMANFKGVLYAPNSPVVIVGNNKNFEGFVVARKFVQLKTAKEFEDEGYKKFVRKDNNDEIFIKEDDIKSDDAVPENCIEINYSGGEEGKLYYIEKACEYFTKVTKERVDSKAKFENVPEMYLDKQGDVQLSEQEITANVTSDYKPENSDENIKVFSKDQFNLNSSTYNSFLLVKFVNNLHLNKVGGIDYFFTYDRGLLTD